MKKTLLIVACALLVAAAPALAGQLQGTVAVTGLRDAANAVVYIDAIPGKTFPPPAKNPVMDQKNMEFQPHVMVVTTGTTVDFLNTDPFLHNVFSPDKCADRFNLGSWPQGQMRSHKFTKECAATLLCNVHPEMEGYVVVVPTPYHAVTDATGAYTIKDIPDGTYTVKVWHPKQAGTSQQVKVSGNTTVNFQLHK